MATKEKWHDTDLAVCVKIMLGLGVFFVVRSLLKNAKQKQPGLGFWASGGFGSAVARVGPQAGNPWHGPSWAKFGSATSTPQAPGRGSWYGDRKPKPPPLLIPGGSGKTSEQVKKEKDAAKQAARAAPAAAPPKAAQAPAAAQPAVDPGVQLTAAQAAKRRAQEHAGQAEQDEIGRKSAAANAAAAAAEHEAMWQSQAIEEYVYPPTSFERFAPSPIIQEEE
jgi:pyruvate/2-oxoglutarate dehydrogenase complex dihydrolipoamide acyltransferase (E2) component